MKTTKKKVISVLSAICALCTGLGCVNGLVDWNALAEENVNAPVVETVKKTTTDDFLLGSWVSYYFWAREGEEPVSMSEQTQAMADAGLNLVTVGKWIPDVGEPVNKDLQSLEWWQHVDKIMGENNMLYMYNSEPGTGHGQEFDNGIASNLSDAAVQNAKNIVPYLENCAGFCIKDEPSYGAIEDLANWSKKYLGIKDGAYPFVNLLPSYASASAIGDSYYDYLEHWVESMGAENIEYLSHDFYPFHEQSTNLEIFQDMEIMRQVGLKYDLKTHGFPQSNAWNGMRMPNADEIRWNVYAYLAYGFKALSYFNLAMWGGEGNYDGLINRYGEIPNQELYDSFVDLNWDVRAMSDIIMNLDCLHAYHTRDNVYGVEMLPDNWIVTPSTNADLVLSYMQAKDNTEPYLMVFNKSFEESVTAQNFSVDKYSGIEGLEYFNPETGKYEEVKIENGTFSLDLLPGEGKFLRIKGNVNLPAELTTPSVDLEAGCYLGERTITITAGDPSDEIYYTLDGTYPTRQSLKYTGEPIVIDAGDDISKNYMLRVIALRGGSFSETVDRSYLVVNESGGVDFSTIENAYVSGDWIINDGKVVFNSNVIEEEEPVAPDLSQMEKSTITAKDAVAAGLMTFPGEAWLQYKDTSSYYYTGWAGFDRVANFTFTGQAITVNVEGQQTFDLGGRINFYIDDVLQSGEYDLNTFDGPKDIITITGLSAGEHTLKIVLPGYSGVTNKRVMVNSFTVYKGETSDTESVNVTKYASVEAYNSGILYLANANDADATPTETWITDGAVIKKGCWPGFHRTIYFDFTGTNATITFGAGGVGGVIEVYVDNVLKETFDGSVADEYVDITAWASEAGDHTVKIKGVSTNAQSKWLIIKDIAYSDAPIVEQEEATDHIFITAKDAYDNGVLVFPGEAWIERGVAFYYTGWAGFDRVAEFTFEGVGVSVNIEGTANAGYLNFYVDGKLQAGTYDPATYTGSKDIITITGLKDGEHTIQVVLPGYYGVTNKSVQLNGFTVIKSQEFNVYRNEATTLEDGMITANLNLSAGAAGYLLTGENDYCLITVSKEGVVSIADSTGIIAAATLESFDASNLQLLVLYYDGMITVYVDGVQVILTEKASFAYKAALYASWDAVVEFSETAVSVIEVEDIVKENVVIGFVSDDMVILEPNTTKEEAIAALPTKVTLNLSDGTTEEAQVVWDSEDYNAAEPGRYRFLGTISGMTHADPFEITVYAYVFNCEDVDYTYIDSIIALKETLNEEDYTIPSWAVVQEYYEIALAVKADKTSFTNAITVAGQQLMDKINLLVNPSLVWSGLDAAIAEGKAIDATLYTQESIAAMNEVVYAAETMTRTGLLQQSDIDEKATTIRAAINVLDELVDAQSLLAAFIEAAEEAIATNAYTAESAAALQAAVDKAKAMTGSVGKSAVTAMQEELNNAYAELVEKPADTDSSSGSDGTDSETPATSSDTDSSSAGSGCFNTIGAVSVAVSMLAAGVVVLAKKRKND